MARFRALLARNHLLDTLITLRGNARVCLYTEPLWGVPTTLFLPLLSKYMEAVGLSSLQIGVVASVFLLSQMLFAMLGGAIADKLGRRWATTLMDIFAWPLPMLLWMNAQGFAWFLLAAFFNGFFRSTENSFSLLVVEDTPPGMLVSLYSLMNVAGLLSGFVAPVASLLIARYSLIATMRGLFLFGFVCMVVKIIILHLLAKETGQGIVRMNELKGKSIFHAFKGGFLVLRTMLTRKPLMLVLGIMSCVMVIRSATDNFWPLLLTGTLGISEGTLPLLSGLRSLTMLVCFFAFSHHLKPERFHKPMRLGLFIMAGIHLALYLLPRGTAWLVFPLVAMEALALSLLIPLFSSLQMLLLDKAEKARMFGFSLAFCLLVTAPFGTVNGMLAKWQQGLPMLLSALLAGLALYFLNRLSASLEQVRLDET